MAEVRPCGGESNSGTKGCNIKFYPAWIQENPGPTHKFVITDCRRSEEKQWVQDVTCFECGNVVYESRPEVLHCS